MACIAIVLVFVLQFTQNQIIYNHMIAVDQEVNAFKEVVKQEGKITEDNKEKLKLRLRSSIGCDIDNIEISGTRSVMMRGGRIHYRVAVPIRGIIGVESLYGTNSSKNGFKYTIDRYTTSEYVGKSI